MISFFNRHKRTIFIITTVTFLGGVFVGLGAYVGDRRTYNDVARVGEIAIQYAAYIKHVNSMLSSLRERGMDVPEALQKQLERQILQEMIMEEALAQLASEYGLVVSDLELAADVQSTPAFMKDGVFNPQIYRQLLWRQLKLKPAEYEAQRRKARLAMKFRQLAMSAAKVSKEEVKEAYLAQGKKEKDFAKDEAETTRELLQLKADAFMEAYLKQFIATHEVKSFLEERQQGV
ncbi:MAG TPA: SurA N-terminal domain-containing protein [Elusimicrobiales bacterium]|nr:SurA N-terminal domain-containing protein [Elusimicrobiales bacterium]